ncbi:unnamed protein product [Laminaria digitata]
MSGRLLPCSLSFSLLCLCCWMWHAFLLFLLLLLLLAGFNGALVIAVFELASIFSTFSGDSNDPWETLLQDPTGSKLFYKKSAAEQERLKLSEVKHSRLAMLAIIGELVQMMMFHKPTLEF